MDKIVPFFANTADDKHCFQAAVKMVLKYYYPNEDYSWKDLEEKTAFLADHGTWSMAGVLWLKEKGLGVKIVDSFDYNKFIAEGGNYLTEINGQEVAKYQIAHSNIEQEQEFSKKVLQKLAIDKRIPTTQDIKKLLDDDYLLIINVNSKKLNQKNGFTGHFVVVKGYEDENLILHDPGLPSQENRRVNFETFEAAWADPNEIAKAIMAFSAQ